MTATCRNCGVRWTGSRICHCAECHRTFTGVRAFDAHRTGPYTARTCRDPASLLTYLDEARLVRVDRPYECWAWPDRAVLFPRQQRDVEARKWHGGR